MMYGQKMATLQDLRGILERMEDNIITSLSDRAGYARNASAYEHGKIPLDGLKDRDAAYHLGPSSINISSHVLDMYMSFLDGISQPGDDGKYIPAAAADMRTLRHLSARVHNGGIGIADVKLIGCPRAYTEAARLGKENGGIVMMRLLTDSAQEERVLNRVREKGARYGLNPSFVHDMFKTGIIPLTKEVEVRRLFEVIERDNLR